MFYPSAILDFFEIKKYFFPNKNFENSILKNRDETKWDFNACEQWIIIQTGPRSSHFQCSTDYFRLKTDHFGCPIFSLNGKKDIDSVSKSGPKKLWQRKKIYLPSTMHRVCWKRMDRQTRIIQVSYQWWWKWWMRRIVLLISSNLELITDQ